MKFYRIDYFASDPTEQATEWETSKTRAEKIARDNHCGDYKASVTEVEAPTDQKGLLAFLNEHIWTHIGAQGPWGGND